MIQTEMGTFTPEFPKFKINIRTWLVTLPTSLMTLEIHNKGLGMFVQGKPKHIVDTCLFIFFFGWMSLAIKHYTHLY